MDKTKVADDELTFYEDEDNGIVATVEIDGRAIKLRGSSEFNAFFDSVMRLTPDAMFQQAVWLEQMSHFVEAGFPGDERILHIWGKTIVPAATHEAQLFLETLYDLGNVPRRAVAVLLRTFAKQFFQIAINRDPSILPGEIPS